MTLSARVLYLEQVVAAHSAVISELRKEVAALRQESEGNRMRGNPVEIFRRVVEMLNDPTYSGWGGSTRMAKDLGISRQLLNIYKSVAADARLSKKVLNFEISVNNAYTQCKSKHKKTEKQRGLPA